MLTGGGSLPDDSMLVGMMRHVMSKVNPGEHSYIIGDGQTAILVEN